MYEIVRSNLFEKTKNLNLLNESELKNRFTIAVKDDVYYLLTLVHFKDYNSCYRWLNIKNGSIFIMYSGNGKICYNEFNSVRNAINAAIDNGFKIYSISSIFKQFSNLFKYM